MNIESPARKPRRGTRKMILGDVGSSVAVAGNTSINGQANVSADSKIDAATTTHIPSNADNGSNGSGGRMRRANSLILLRSRGSSGKVVDNDHRGVASERRRSRGDACPSNADDGRGMTRVSSLKMMRSRSLLKMSSSLSSLSSSAASNANATLSKNSTNKQSSSNLMQYHNNKKKSLFSKHKGVMVDTCTMRRVSSMNMVQPKKSCLKKATSTPMFPGGSSTSLSSPSDHQNGTFDKTKQKDNSKSDGAGMKRVASMKKVGFNQIELREYPMILGDNPSTVTGAPVTVDWKHQKERHLKVDLFELHKEKRRSKKKKSSSSSRHSFPSASASLGASDIAPSQNLKPIPSIRRVEIALKGGSSLSDVGRTCVEMAMIQHNRTKSAQKTNWENLRESIASGRIHGGGGGGGGGSNGAVGGTNKNNATSNKSQPARFSRVPNDAHVVLTNWKQGGQRAMKSLI